MGGKVGRVSGGSGEGVSRFWRQPGGFTAYHNEHFTMWTRQGIELGPFTVAHEKKILIRQCTANKDPRTCTEDLGSFPRDLPFAPARSSRCAPSAVLLLALLSIARSLSPSTAPPRVSAHAVPKIRRDCSEHPGFDAFGAEAQVALAGRATVAAAAACAAVISPSCGVPFSV